MQDGPQNIKIVEGDGSQLDISPVYDHINNLQQPRKKKKEDIVIPKVRKKAPEKNNEDTAGEAAKEDIEEN